MTLAEFDGLRLRATDEQDEEKLRAWIDADPDHAGQFEPEYFMGSEGCFALEDAAGVVFFIRLTKVARVRIQFNAEAKGMRQKLRVSQALARGMALLEVGLSRAGTEEWVFDTANPDLRRFALDALGFKDSPDNLVREIRAEREADETEVA